MFPPRSHNVRVVEWPSLRKVFHLESTQVDSWSEMAPDGRFLVTMRRGKGEWQISRYDVPAVRPWLLIGLVTALTGMVLLAGRWLLMRWPRRRPSGTPPADSSPAAPPAASA